MLIDLMFLDVLSLTHTYIHALIIARTKSGTQLVYIYIYIYIYIYFDSNSVVSFDVIFLLSPPPPLSLLREGEGGQVFSVWISGFCVYAFPSVNNLNS